MSAPAPPPTPSRRPISRRRKWLFRLAALILGPALFLGLLEVVLRIGGYGHSTAFLHDGLAAEGPGTVIDNPDFGKWVFPRRYDHPPAPVPLVMAAEKPAGACRVFVLGESAAMGFPEPAFGFCRVLEVLLKARYPGMRVEIVNAAVVAINSHVVLPIARECAGYQPDLFVVHVGNNEVVGPFGASGVLGPDSSSLALIRANLRVKRARVGQLLDALVHGFGSDAERRPWGGMMMFLGAQVPAGDPRLTRVYAHFRRNLDDICSLGVPAVVCTIPVNLKDGAPFASAHGPDLAAGQEPAWTDAFEAGSRDEAAGRPADALAAYSTAAQLDPAYAEVEYRIGRCLLKLGRADGAAGHFARARDLDTLRFRTDATLNQTIREVAAARAGDGVALADAERAFAEASKDGIPGEEYFYEHVHMNFAGNYKLARTVLDAAAPTLDARFGLREPAPAPPTVAECAARMGFTDAQELNLARQVRDNLLAYPPFTNQSDRAERTSRWTERITALSKTHQVGGPERATESLRRAVEAAPEDWTLRMKYGEFLAERGSIPEAEEQFRAATGLIRHNPRPYCQLGLLRLRARDPAGAADRFREAIARNPDLSEAHFGLAAALAAQGRVDEGLAIYEQRLRSGVDRADVLLSMGVYLMQANRADAAEARLREAAEAQPENPMPHAYLGDLAAGRGRRGDAVAEYQAALKLRPDWPEVRARLDRLAAAGGPQ